MDIWILFKGVKDASVDDGETLDNGRPAKFIWPDGKEELVLITEAGIMSSDTKKFPAIKRFMPLKEKKLPHLLKKGAKLLIVRIR